MATQRLSSVLSHITPGQKPIDRMYTSPQFAADDMNPMNSAEREGLMGWLTDLSV